MTDQNTMHHSTCIILGHLAVKTCCCVKRKHSKKAVQIRDNVTTNGCSHTNIQAERTYTNFQTPEACRHQLFIKCSTWRTAALTHYTTLSPKQSLYVYHIIPHYVPEHNYICTYTTLVPNRVNKCTHTTLSPDSCEYILSRLTLRNMI